MTFKNMYQAKTNLSRLVDKAISGQKVIIARAGKPLVELVPYQPEKKMRKPGKLKGKIKIPANFDQASPEIEALFRGES